MNTDYIKAFKEVRKKYQGKKFKASSIIEPYNNIHIIKVFNSSGGGFYCAYERKDSDGIRKGQAFFYFEELERI